MGDLQFAYWVPNVSGGLVVSKLPQKTDWNFEANKRYAQTAEEFGFDYALLQTRFFASYGAEYQLEAITLASALAAVTNKLKLISAVHPGLWHPGVYAKMLSTLDQISNGRAAVNVVSGWFKQEFIGYGEHWLEHDERYRRSEEFIQVLRSMFTEETTNHKGDFYRINDAPMKPKPVQKGNLPIFQGGNSKAAKEMAARVSDYYFMNGNTLEGFKKQIDEVRALAAKEGRTVKFAANGFAIVRDTEEEAVQLLRDIVSDADVEAVEGFRGAVKEAGQSTRDKDGMWANSSFKDLVQYNDGFKTGLIGTPEQVADQIIELKKIGIDLVLTGHFHYEEDLQRFGEQVIPLVKQKEKQLKEEGVTV
ncbi:dimethyl sulfone monooxygenase SfnG [Aquibacillus sp. 3ASR75-11]|uniref:Dimethyl sulfone monooxygenase SfnG n=1 Tax=Terrihalobacillus insolitus TaxID=2950438 RepID=A0A9X4AM60_9BACI|nr:dimethyl sulfone monooxygenase SfnG [Terrihalobacillus insolitus]MDC3412132.1 dimethyl sulfone monooxygenase SfnG [Terrihalobacillus insolitus]MDC3423175.1 dimethyl sulfone monooxygenase SfnG [Terrihalobacillus insolitus]